MFEQGIQYTHTVTMVTELCCNCGVPFGIPSYLRDKLVNDSAKYFYCPNGHSQHFAKSKEQRLREEAEYKLRQKESELSQVQIQNIQLESQLDKTSRKLRKVEKRISNGVCPCCNRTFKDLAAHMKTKHPDHSEKEIKK